MTNFDFILNYEQLQLGIMHAGSDKFDFGEYFFGMEDDSSCWNHLVTNQLLSVENLTKIESYCTSHSRKNAIYFENTKLLSKLIDFLTSSGYQKISEDSWMFIDKTEFNPNFKLVKKVETPSDLDIFIKTFDQCYRKDDPQNPYGELGDYLKSTIRAWNQLHSKNNLEYFIVYKHTQPVAVSTLTSFNGIGYISNIGSLQEVRGQGFGKLATLYTVYHSQQKGNTTHCLATEEGTYPNEFYKKIGFKTKFTGLLFEKSK